MSKAEGIALFLEHLSTMPSKPHAPFLDFDVWLVARSKPKAEIIAFPPKIFEQNDLRRQAMMNQLRERTEWALKAQAEESSS